MSSSRDESDRDHSVRGARTNSLTLLGQATSFLFGAAAARLFGQAAWGSYTTAFAWCDVLVRTSLLATDKAVLVFVPARRAMGDEQGALRAIGTSVRVTLLASVTFALLMFGASYPVTSLSGEPRDGIAMRYLSAYVVVGAVLLLLLAATMSAKVLRFNLLAKGLTEPGLVFAFAVLFGALMPQMETLALVPVAAGLVALAVAWQGMRTLFDVAAIVRVARRDRMDREMTRFALPLALSEFLNIVAMRLGSFVLIAYVVVDDRAVFNTAMILAGTISFVRGVFDTVLGPIAAEAWAEGDHGRLAHNLKVQSSLVLLFAVPLASVFIVGGAALLAVYGTGFVDGHRTLVWLALGHLVNATLGLVGWVLMAARRSGAMLRNNAIKVAVELALCLVLIPQLGIEGAAIATFTAIAALHGLQIWEVWRVAAIHPFSLRMFQLALIGGAWTAGELVLYQALPGTVLFRAAVALLTGIPLYFVAVWHLRSRNTESQRPL